MINKKLLVSIFLTLGISLSLSSINVQAKVCKKSNKEIKEIVYDSASENMDWNNISIQDIKNVYDFNDQLVAYSVNIENEDSLEKGYEIIDSKTNDVLQFSKQNLSPYTKVNQTDTCLYNGFFNYYSKDNFNNYYNLKDDKKLSNEEIRDEISISSEKEQPVKLNNSLTASNKSSTPTSKPVEKILYDVGDENWYKGCTPTAIAMVLGYDYYDNTPEFRPLVDVLAPAIGTDKTGSTIIDDNVIKGIKNTMKRFEIPDVWCQLDKIGKNNSTYNEYVKEINENHPVVAMFYNSKFKTPAYSQGFGNHSTAGVGYKYTNKEQFIIVHDTAVEGEVYCNFNDPTLAQNQWLYIH